ncbi:MAG: hypothetical protein ACTSW7_00505 [Candidatus Thorarchaeota archaeon]|nr:hypothetical protein [Thermoplasmatales archaeon]
MAKKSGGHVEIHLFPRGDEDGKYYVGDFGDASCDIDLKDYTIFIYKDEKNPQHRVLVFRPRDSQ